MLDKNPKELGRPKLGVVWGQRVLNKKKVDAKFACTNGGRIPGKTGMGYTLYQVWCLE